MTHHHQARTLRSKRRGYSTFWSTIAAISAITAWLVSIRDISIGTDTLNYIRFFNYVAADIERRISEPVFTSLALLSSAAGGEYQLFFFAVSFLSFISIIYSYTLLVRYEHISAHTNFTPILISLLFLPLWRFYAEMQINTIRTALAVPFLYIALLLCWQRRFALAFGSLLLAASIHHSMIVFVAGAPLLFLGSKKIVGVMVALSVLYVTGISEYVMRTVIPDAWLRAVIGDLSNYIGHETERYRAGVRLDFLAFSMFFFFLMYWRHRKHPGPLFRIYAALLVPFMWAGFMPYSDRLLSAPWALIPLFLGLLVSDRLPAKAVYFFFITAFSFPLIFYLTTLNPY